MHPGIVASGIVLSLGIAGCGSTTSSADHGGSSGATSADGTGGASSGTGGGASSGTGGGASSGTGGGASSGTGGAGGSGALGDAAVGGGSGISPTKKMSELTTAEATAFCKAHQSDFDAIAKGGCVLATSLLVGVTGCQQQCAGVTSSIDCNATDVSNLAGCSVTVGNVASCLDQMGTYYDALQCGSLAFGGAPSCTKDLQSQCAGLFGGGNLDGGA